MRKHTRTLLLILTVLVIPGAVSLVTSKGQNKSKQHKQSAVVLRRQEQAASSPTEQEVLDQLPIAEAFGPESADPEKRTQRKKKNARHDNRRTREITEAPYPLNVSLNIDWWQGLPALPLAESDVVLLGEIIDGHAYLSNDRTGVYSEFTIHAEEVFKNQPETSVVKGSEVAVERSGGAVRFPSGAIQRFTTINQRMPLVGRRYVLFLKRIDGDDSFSIVTGYELRGQQVMPLDGSSNPNGDKLPFDIYKATDIHFFLDSIRASVAEQSERGTNQ
jgi:hypothetical protein